MHIDDITAALAARDMVAIKEAFLLLANYPNGETWPRRRQCNDVLRSCCALRSDFKGARHADGAALVVTDHQMWSDHFAMILRAGGRLTLAPAASAARFV